MYCQYCISQDPPRTCRAINEVVHSLNLPFHPILLPWCEGFTVWLARYYHHVPGLRITVIDLRVMDLSKDGMEAR
jgi:hypothetical protein